MKIISRWGVGFNEVDVFAATEKGVVVAYTPGMLNEAVADYAFSLRLSPARHVHKGHLEMTQGKWAPTWGNLPQNGQWANESKRDENGPRKGSISRSGLPSFRLQH